MAIPVGGEDRAREFYGALLGMTEIPRPEALAGRGGCWFRAGSAEIHCGIEDGFRPARKAHPALVVSTFDELAARLTAAQIAIRPDNLLPDTRRFYVDDPFGNRIEVVGA